MLNRIRKLKVLKPLKIFYRYFRFGKCPSFAKPKFFLNNSRNQETACFILAGYKSFTWEIVFKRIKAFCPKNIDICIVSSGIFSKELLEIAQKNSWSYLQTKKNNVCLALNTAIKNFSSAKNIFKLDEDIFVTKDFFTNLPKIHEESKEKYFPCFTAPLIPINGFGYSKILEKLNLIEEYKKHFEEPRVSAGSWMQIENNLEVAKFFWGKKNFVPQIDELNKRLRKIGGGYLICPIRFSIGAIFLERKTLEEVGFFPVYKGNGMGSDEVFLCNLATTSSKAIIVSETSCVGHLSFGKQNQGMKEYFLENKEIFDIKEE